MSEGIAFIAVHVGAGYHSARWEEGYRRCMRNALLAAASKRSPFEAICTAISLLEDDHLTNAGTGSNLNLEGKVECDASMMQSVVDSRGLFGAVGNLSCIRNPILVAARLLHEQKMEPLPLGMIRPLFLVGEGAKQWAISRNIEAVDESQLITEKSMQSWKKHSKMLHDHENSIDESSSSSSTPCSNPAKRKQPDVDESELVDTVGAICLGYDGVIVAGVSSGGMSLKASGRIGEAAMFGGGCWAECTKSIGIACSISGTGEQIMQDLMAKECSVELNRSEFADEGIRRLFDKFLLHSSQDSPRRAGLIAIKNIVSTEGEEDIKSDLEFVWAHCTESMGIGYLVHNRSSNSFQQQPKTFISRLPSCNQSSVLIESKHFQFHR